MKAPWTDPGLRELLALAALAALGCGLALAQGEFFFGAIFAAASALIIVEALRRFRGDHPNYCGSHPNGASAERPGRRLQPAAGTCHNAPGDGAS